ncbi:MAG: hypothetical protein PHH98_01055 [Candidatus Gracilibacteria bacterium]|nr:hypothetical protein [Candidatus Gracilibacteria bacterium]
MELEKVLDLIKQKSNDKDILEHLGIRFRIDYENQDYYNDKMHLMHRGDYFISDLDGTFFRGVLQKEAFTIFVKFVKKHNYLDLNIDDYYLFLKDLEFFNKLEKKAYNKEIEFFEYLNAGIYLLLKHKDLVDWNGYLSFMKYSFKTKEKINPFRFSFSKMKEVLLSGGNFVFVSGSPNFVFDIYLELLKEYVAKNIGDSYSNNIFGFGSNVFMDCSDYTPLWGRDHKKQFINLLRDKRIINKTIGGMGDTSSDFGISYALDPDNEFYFVNPEKKVVDNFEKSIIETIDYKLIIERKDLIFNIKKEDINFI